MQLHAAQAISFCHGKYLLLILVHEYPYPFGSCRRQLLGWRSDTTGAIGIENKTQRVHAQRIHRRHVVGKVHATYLDSHRSDWIKPPNASPGRVADMNLSPIRKPL